MDAARERTLVGLFVLIAGALLLAGLALGPLVMVGLGSGAFIHALFYIVPAVLVVCLVVCLIIWAVDKTNKACQ